MWQAKRFIEENNEHSIRLFLILLMMQAYIGLSNG